MIYFTADTHFCHADIIRFCKRPFADVDEMNETLVEKETRQKPGLAIEGSIGATLADGSTTTL
jgi:hypothetical protein